MISCYNYPEKLNIIRRFINFNYNLSIDGWCWLLKNIEHNDVISQYPDHVLIHQGGQRVVFKILHPKYGNVALKIGYYTTPTNQEGWEFERIQREVDILRQIDSSYYPKNFEFQKIPNDRYLILEEYIPSPPLSECLEKFQKPVDALNLIKDLVIGLKIIWDKKIVHRDLKPDNILITQNGRAKIIDLGIARMLDRDSITQTIYGGPLSRLYAAPEQHRYNKKLIDWRTDQFALGIVLVQLLLKGKHPFDPILVGGDSIPSNIVNNNWCKNVFATEGLLPISLIASKMLGSQQFQRYKNYESLLAEINSCLGVFV